VNRITRWVKTQARRRQSMLADEARLQIAEGGWSESNGRTRLCRPLRVDSDRRGWLANWSAV